MCVCCEVPLHVAQFDVWPGVAHDAAKFLRNVLWCTIQNQEPGYQLGVTRACVHVRVNRVDVQESVLRDPVRRRVGHELARKEWSMRVHSIGLPSQTICVHMPPLMFAASVTVTKAREAKTWADSALLGPPTLACWNHAHSCLVQVPHAILRDSEAIAQVDDAQLQEFALSGNVSLTRPVAGVSRRKLP